MPIAPKRTMALSKKITTAALLPAGFMVLFAVGVSLYFWQHYRSAEAIKQIAILINATSCLVHELQKERGMSAGFIGSGGKKFASALLKQRSATDTAIASFRGYSPEGIRDEKLANMLRAVNGKLERLEEVRSRVDNLSIDKKEAVAYYTELTNRLIALIGLMVHHSKDVHVGARIVALKEFSKAKDLEGIKRALLSIVFAQNRFDRETLLTFTKVAGREDAHLESFREIAPFLYTDYFEKLRTRPEFKKAESLEALALSKMEGYGVDPEEWFRIQTEKIDYMKEMEDFMLADISKVAGELSSSALRKFGFTTVLALLLLGVTGTFVYRIIRDVNERIREVVDNVVTTAEKMEFEISTGKGGSRNDEFSLLEKAISDMLHTIGSVVETIRSVMERVAQGYFSQRIEGEFRGDIKALVDNINTSLDNLQNTMFSVKRVIEAVSKGNLKVRIEDSYEGDLKELTTYINSALSDLQSLLKQVKDDIINVTSNIASITTSVDETSEAIRQISEETLKAKNKAVDMEKAINTGKTRVRDMHSAMNDIVSVSREVTSITETIVTIAEQTNLLALNAAIEAARAGEMGRGFAVVADEVRRLAEISAKAAKEIASLLERASNTIEAGQMSAEQVVESYKRIEEVVSEVASSIDTIATAMEEQSRAVDLIRDNIADISRSTDRIEENIKKFEV